jgi:hypothetical protein
MIELAHEAVKAVIVVLGFQARIENPLIEGL